MLTLKPRKPHWPMAKTVDRQARRFETMMQCLDTDVLRAARDDHGATLARARGECLRCLRPGACPQSLDDLCPLPAAAPEYCPNKPFFERFARITSQHGPPGQALTATAAISSVPG